MRVAFYIKLFIAFLAFATFLLMLFFFLSKNFYQKHYENMSSNTFSEFLNYKKQIFEDKIEKYNLQLKSIIDSEAYSYFVNYHKDKPLKDLLEVALNSHTNIIEFKVINRYSRELLSLKKDDDKIIIKSENYLSSALEKQEFYEVLKLEDNQTWHSFFKLHQENGELVYPAQPVMKFIIKSNNYYVMLIINAQSFLNQHFQLKNYETFIISEEGDFLIHHNKDLNWSAYFNPQITIKNEFPNDYRLILKYETFVTSEYISQKIKIDNHNSIIILIKFDNTILQEFKDSNYIIVVIGVILSVVLALLFTNPIAKLNKELEDEKEHLNLSVIQNENLLDDSLELLDKYVIYIKFDLNFKIIDVSSYYCEISGYEKSELIGQNYKLVLHDDVDFDEIYRTINDGKVYSGEIKNLKKFGEFFWLASNYEPNLDAQKNIVSYTAICSNITYQKKIHTLYSDLNNQIEQLNAIFHNANSGIALLNYEGEFENTNKAFANLLGFSNEEFLKLNIFSLTLENKQEFLQMMLKQAKEFGSMSNLEVVMVSKNKEYIHLNISLSVLPDRSHVVMVANSLEDKRKLLELNTTLEQRVYDEVQKNIAQEKLHQEQQIKNAKLTSIGTLAGGITHEINTPLTYLKGNFEMMQYDIEDLPDSNIKQNMLSDSEKINEAINRIANIVESMREMSQSSSESNERVNLYSTMITSLTMAYNRSKQISKIYLNNQLFEINNINKNEFEYYATVQKQRVEQVWVIIINNALDELQKIEDYEQRSLHINFIEYDEKILIRFSDNAGGIKSEILDKIFEPFVSSKEHSGMGVGLNIAKKIIDDQDAVIKAYNKNDGAVFEVFFKKTV